MDFSIDEHFKYAALLEEAIETIETCDIEMGPGQRSVVATERTKEISLLQQLKESQALFASELTVQRLEETDFQARGLEPAPEIRNWMKDHNFFLVQVPVTLMPAEGWAFTKLECSVTFDAPEGGTIPKAHAIYPESVWDEILKMQISLNLGLDESLTFKAGVKKSETALANLSSDIRGKVAATADGKVKLAAGPFNYSVYREIALSRGRENNQVFWRLNTHEQVQKEEPFLAVVLRAPREIKRIQPRGAMIAYTEFNFGGAPLSKWFGKFREKVQAFIKNGLPQEVQADDWPVIVNL